LKGKLMADEITVSDLALELETNAWVLDVREDDEFADGHVPNVHHIPLGQLPDKFHLIPKEEKIFVICRSGARSQSGADYLIGQGYDAISVAGGTMGWISSGRDVSFDASL
jgi:rhodanese-related sulfurtransferase